MYLYLIWVQDVIEKSFDDNLAEDSNMDEYVTATECSITPTVRSRSESFVTSPEWEDLAAPTSMTHCDTGWETYHCKTSVLIKFYCNFQFFFSLIYKGGTSKKLNLNGRKLRKQRKSRLLWIFQNRKSRGQRTREGRVRSSCRWKKESKCVVKNVQINYTVIWVLAHWILYIFFFNALFYLSSIQEKSGKIVKEVTETTTLRVSHDTRLDIASYKVISNTTQDHRENVDVKEIKDLERIVLPDVHEKTNGSHYEMDSVSKCEIFHHRYFFY